MRRWACLEIRCGAEAADELAAVIAEAFGVSVEVLAEGIRLYLREELFFEEGRQKLDGILSSLKIPAPEQAASSRYVLSTLEEEDWLRKWKHDFRSLRVGKHLIIAPTWEEHQPNPGDRIIHVDPGQAFGTGHHETTRLCLEWLEVWAESRTKGSLKSLLDVGTGTGILAIAAAMLGFAPILALDNDPEAVPVARGNLELNGVSDKIDLYLGSAAEIEGDYGVVLANIQALPLIEMAPLLEPRLEASGRLVLSGILVEQAAMITRAYEAQGLKLGSRKVAGEWCLLEFARAKGRQESCHVR